MVYIYHYVNYTYIYTLLGLTSDRLDLGCFGVRGL